jgi:hypothetical protein
MSARFASRVPTHDECWRAIVLMGQNVASYRFGLARALLSMRRNFKAM